MQTTIQLDDALFAQALKLATDKGYDLSHFIDEILRDKIASKPPALAVPEPRFRLTTVGGNGVHPGIDLNNSAALLSVVDKGAAEPIVILRCS